MTRTSRAKRGYTQADIDAVSDNPEWTEEDFKRARPFAEVFPELAKSIRRRGPQKEAVKQAVSIRLDADIVAAYKATGAGWQSRINTDLKKAAKKLKVA